ncbi:MAG: leucine-rich repeat domain-containing protein, partial [Lachnospiraceae bacterium]|nr:leucine-rich repeat domain-containing protein [Lachnospiraceae bacterium]
MSEDGNWNDANREVVISVKKAGTLRLSLPEDYIYITSLTVSGNLDGTDLAFIRTMAGSDEYLNKTEGRLRNLDLSNAKFTDGGTYIIIGNTSYVSAYNVIPPYLFAYCDKLQTIVLPEGISSIGKGAFYECSALADVNIPDTIMEIGEYAFYKCSKLSSAIIIPQNVTKISKATFYECSELFDIYLPESIECIDDYAFEYCTKLMSLGSLKNLMSVGKYSFAYCRNLRYFDIPVTMSTVPNGAFFSCVHLTEMDFSHVSMIGDYAFGACKKLEKVVFGQNLKYIGKYAFELSGIKGNLIFPKTLNFIGGGAFLNTGIVRVDIYSDLKTTDDDTLTKGAFGNCNELLELVVHEGVKTLGVAFESCGKLTLVSLPESLENIGYGDDIFVHGGYIFSYCTALDNIEIPSSV